MFDPWQQRRRALFIATFRQMFRHPVLGTLMACEALKRVRITPSGVVSFQVRRLKNWSIGRVTSLKIV